MTNITGPVTLERIIGMIGLSALVGYGFVKLFLSIKRFIDLQIYTRRQIRKYEEERLERFIGAYFGDGPANLEVGVINTSNLKKEMRMRNVVNNKDRTVTGDLESGNVEFKSVEDIVNDPQHYKLDGLDIESIDVIKAVLGDEFKAFCKGNVLKYVMRADKKNGIEDLKKAKVYLDWILEEK